MPLYVLLILVVGGISGVALALHMLGLSRVPRWSEDQARAAWLREFPDMAPRAVTLNAAGTAAMIASDNSRGLVWQFGADSAVHLLEGHHLQDHRRGLRVVFADFAVPSTIIPLTDAETPIWKKELAPDG